MANCENPYCLRPNGDYLIREAVNNPKKVEKIKTKNTTYQI